MSYSPFRISGSNILLEGGGGIAPFALPANYVIFSGSVSGYTGPYYAISGSDNKVAFNGTSASSVIQSALSRGGKIFIRKGYYSLTGSALSLISNTILEGEGSGSLLIRDSFTAASMMGITGLKNVIVKDLCLDFNGFNSATGGGFGNIRIDTSSSFITLQSLVVKNSFSGSSSTGSMPGGGRGITISSGDDCKIINCNIDSCNPYGILLGGVINRLDIIGNKITNCGGVSSILGMFTFDINGDYNGIRIERNELIGRGRENQFSGSGIVFPNSSTTHFCRDVIVAHNRIIDMERNGISLASPTDIGAFSNIRVIGNRIDSCGPTGSTNGDAMFGGGSNAKNIIVTENHFSSGSDSGIGANAPYTIINNNIFEYMGHQGIALNADNQVCIGNICRNNGQKSPFMASAAYGINIFAGTIDNCVVIGNQCVDDQAVKTQVWGINLSGAASGSIIMGNICEGNISGSIQGQNITPNIIVGNLQ